MSQLATHSYQTVDSNHPGYVLRRSYWVAPAFLVTFAIASAGMFLAMPEIIPEYASTLRRLGGVGEATLTTPQSLSFRPFFALVLVLFALFVSTPFLSRVLLVALSAVAILATVTGVDLLLIKAHEVGGPEPFSLAGNVINGFASLFKIGRAHV